MSASLCPLFNAVQQFTDQGVVLSGGKIYSYLTGSTTPQATWTDSTQTVPNANPIILSPSGRLTQEIWQDSALIYKYVLQDSVGNQLGVWDNITGLSNATTASPVVSSITALRLVSKNTSSNVFVSGYYASGDGGGGPYYYDPTDTTSADNGGTIIVAADGGRWKLVVQDYVTVKQFGAKGDGVTDDLAACQAAVNALKGTANARLRFPAGTFLLSSALIVSLFLVIEGDGSLVSIIKTTSSTADTITFNAGTSSITGCSVRDLYFASSAPKTGGYYINFTASTGGTHFHVDVRNIRTDANAFGGVNLHAAYFTHLRNIEIGGVQANGIGFNLLGISATNEVASVFMSDCWVLSGVAGTTTTGFHFGSFVEGIYCYNCSAETSGINYGLVIDNSLGSGNFTPKNIWLFGCIFDANALIGIYVVSVQNLQLVNCWATSCVNGSGIWLDSNAIDVQVNGGSYITNGTDGITLNGCKTVRITQATIAGNSALSPNSSPGINIKPGTTDFVISNNRFNRSGGTASHYADIYIAPGASDKYDVHDNICDGFVTNPIADFGTGTAAKVHDNVGYNPVGVAFPATPASGSSYTAGHTPETLYIIGGTVSAVATFGQTMFTTSNVSMQLGPNESVVITYTVAPSLKSVRH